MLGFPANIDQAVTMEKKADIKATRVVLVEKTHDQDQLEVAEYYQSFGRLASYRAKEPQPKQERNSPTPVQKMVFV